MKSTRHQRGFSKIHAASWSGSPAVPVGSRRTLAPRSSPDPTPPRSPWREAPSWTRRLLTDDGLLGGGRGSGQPQGHRCAQQQAQRVQQVSRARHGAGRLPPSFKGSAAGWSGAAAAWPGGGGWRASGWAALRRGGLWEM